MRTGEASETARMTAEGRAIHQLEDRPLIFEDPFAVQILGEDPRREGYRKGLAYLMRGFVVARSAYAEEAIDRAIARGVRRVVILGAGLDTFALRSQHEEIEIIEVDHPATQAWKQERIAEAGIPIPPNVSFAPIDFTRTNLEDGLGAIGVSTDRTTVFSWLGVTYYLPTSEFWATMQVIRRFGTGSEVVFDCMPPREAVAPAEAGAYARNEQAKTREKEPFVGFFRPEELAHDLTSAGFDPCEIIDIDGINAKYFTRRSDGLKAEGGVFLVDSRC